jgi:glycerol-1-phosphate dehydrogenase [NAD(P)+]
VVLPAPAADGVPAEDLAARTRHADALIAAGSGTLDDLCATPPFATGRPCAVSASARSMNEYVTGTAALNRTGHKSMLAAGCAAPPKFA